MDNYFESILMEAIFICEGKISSNQRNGFLKIYPFTTENLKGFTPNFDLKDKSLLTVGSSTDQVINAYINGCNNITVIDICPFTKYYFYLKISGIICLEFEDFLSFFYHRYYRDFPCPNTDTFNLETFNKIKPTLRLLDYESYLFWDELFSTYYGIDIRKKLFSGDEETINTIKQINYYLSSEELFNYTKKNIHKLKPNFITNDILNVNLNDKFDNIWLSNIGKYIGIIKLKTLVDKLTLYLNQEGKILVCYLYDTTKEKEYNNNWNEIYNLNKFFDIFKDYNLELINFPGINDIAFNCNYSNDAIVLYRKK